MKHLLYLFLLVVLLSGCASSDALEQDLQTLFDEAVATGKLHGVALVIAQSDTLLFETHGFSDVEQTHPLTADSPFYLASVSKLFTQVALMRLVQRGELQLDEPIASYRPSLDSTIASILTARHLIEMTGGLPREFHEDVQQSGVFFDPQGYAGPFLDTLTTWTLSSIPGEKAIYSNVSYWVLGAVLEAATHKTIADIFADEIFIPLGLDHAGIGSTDSVATGFLSSHGENAWLLAELDVTRRYTSGGVYASLSDMHAFVNGVWKNEDYLTEASRSYLLSLSSSPEPTVWAGNGAMPGFTNMVYYEQERGILILLLNSIGANPPTPQKTFSVRNALIQRITGVVEEPKQSTIEIISMDSFPISAAMGPPLLALSRAIETASIDSIAQVFSTYGVPGEFDDSGDFFAALATAKAKLSPGFTLDGWQRKENLGLSIWFSNALQNNLLEVALYPSKNDTTLVENIGVRQIGFTLSTP